MTEEQRQLCRDLIVHPPALRMRTISKEDFISQLPSAVEHGKLALEWLDEAFRERSPEDLQCVLIVGFAFGFVPEHKEILCRLIEADWHYSHEDIVVALETWSSPDTVNALFCATQWIPKSLEYDDNRALAVKAIWALGRIPGTEAGAKLERLARSDIAVIRKTAIDQLERRHKDA